MGGTGSFGWIDIIHLAALFRTCGALTSHSLAECSGFLVSWVSAGDSFGAQALGPGTLPTRWRGAWGGLTLAPQHLVSPADISHAIRHRGPCRVGVVLSSKLTQLDSFIYPLRLPAARSAQAQMLEKDPVSNMNHASNEAFLWKFRRESRRRKKKKKFGLPQAKLGLSIHSHQLPPPSPFLSFFPYHFPSPHILTRRPLQTPDCRSNSIAVSRHPNSARPILTRSPPFLPRMLRQGLRRCAPVKRAPFALSTASPCQPLVSQVARTQRVTVLPPLRNAFHLSRILSQSATADAPVASDAAEPASALPEFMAFEDSIAAGVHPNLIRAITQDMKYTHMSEVQERTLQAMLKGKDM